MQNWAYHPWLGHRYSIPEMREKFMFRLHFLMQNYCRLVHPKFAKTESSNRWKTVWSSRVRIFRKLTSGSVVWRLRRLKWNSRISYPRSRKPRNWIYVSLQCIWCCLWSGRNIFWSRLPILKRVFHHCPWCTLYSRIRFDFKIRWSKFRNTWVPVFTFQYFFYFYKTENENKNRGWLRQQRLMGPAPELAFSSLPHFTHFGLSVWYWIICNFWTSFIHLFCCCGVDPSANPHFIILHRLSAFTSSPRSVLQVPCLVRDFKIPCTTRWF
jgi:hypothetical protein